ncbi:hypothetical protein ER57_18490 [Smithella sp. SCADC]|jgi:ribosomal protein L21E|nr:hypothetical protein ER57_18490 [Smithella sp. SCADC]
MAKINIDILTETELIELNQRIVQKLRFLREARAHQKMMEFSVGDQVSFQPEGSETLIGIITRYNKKTVTVITEQGHRWNVSPGLLRRVKNARKINSANVFNFQKS